MEALLDEEADLKLLLLFAAFGEVVVVLVVVVVVLLLLLLEDCKLLLETWPVLNETLVILRVLLDVLISEVLSIIELGILVPSSLVL